MDKMELSLTPDIPAERRTSLGELAGLFLRLGATAFGGPAAHIAMMRDEVVSRRGWLTEEHFLDLLGATNLIPGPNSTELAIHIGWNRRRWAGLLVAGVCFILPAMLITAGFAWAYVRFGAVPEVAWLLYGVKPVIVVVVLQAIVGLAPRAARSWPLRLLGGGSALAVALGLDELAVLMGAGVAAAVLRRPPPRNLARMVPLLPIGVGVTTALPAIPVSLTTLFLVFTKIGSVLFGSGYVLVALLRSELVEGLHWLTEAQLIDAIAVGQVTPGPVFSTATFIGYVLAGPKGAIVATIGIFLPAFVFVALSGPLVPRLRASPMASGFLDGVNVASLALMAVVTVQIAGAAIVDVPTALVGLVAAFLLFRARVGSTWLVAGGAACGIAAHSAGLVAR